MADKNPKKREKRKLPKSKLTASSATDSKTPVIASISQKSKDSTKSK